MLRGQCASWFVWYCADLRRVISSRGGTLESKIQLAEEYAFAETIENPSKKQVEQMNAVNPEGNLAQLTITAESKGEDCSVATALEQEINIMEQTFDDHGNLKSQEQVTVSTEQPVFSQAPPLAPPRRPSVPAFRDPQWLETERSYHELAVKELNGLTRSYNLMAPDLAKKVRYMRVALFTDSSNLAFISLISRSSES